jgi:arabinan endo-1,5-alpha-L-arabinosidase
MRIAIFILIMSVFAGARCQSSQIIVHDPVAIHSEGKYEMYCTGRGISSFESEDGIHWKFLTRVFEEIPDWCKKEVPKFDGNIWAPDISFHNGKYYLYYSISSFASNRSAIGVATNTTLDPSHPDYSWEDHGIVVETVPGRDHFNAIDPNLAVDEEGTPWLVFGSFWGGIKLVKLNNDLVSIAQPQQWVTLATRERTFGLEATDPGDGAIEAPFIFHRNGFYYLFVSFDLCCRGPRSTYNVRVGRSDKITGPYIDREGTGMEQGGGSLVLKGDADYYGIGHNSVYEFEGETLMYAHGYDAHDNGRPKLVVYRVHWDEDQWPVPELVEE